MIREKAIGRPVHRKTDSIEVDSAVVLGRQQLDRLLEFRLVRNVALIVVSRQASVVSRLMRGPSNRSGTVSDQRGGISVPPTSSAPERARDLLFDLLGTDRLKPGDRLPSEKALCRQLGFSRPSIREALRQLEHERVLHCVQGRGRFVTGNRKRTWI